MAGLAFELKSGEGICDSIKVTGAVDISVDNGGGVDIILFCFVIVLGGLIVVEAMGVLVPGGDAHFDAGLGDELL